MSVHAEKKYEAARQEQRPSLLQIIQFTTIESAAMLQIQFQSEFSSQLHTKVNSRQIQISKSCLKKSLQEREEEQSYTRDSASVWN